MALVELLSFFYTWPFPTKEPGAGDLNGIVCIVGVAFTNRSSLSGCFYNKWKVYVVWNHHKPLFQGKWLAWNQQC